MSLLALLPIIGEVIKKVIPDPVAAAEANYKVLDLAQRGELTHLDAEVKIALGQIEINKIDAASASFFKGGWRPAVGWTCTFGLFYEFILRPLLPWFLTIAGVQVPPLPPSDMGTLITMLGGLLGLGALRTVERVQGKS